LLSVGSIDDTRVGDTLGGRSRGVFSLAVQSAPDQMVVRKQADLLGNRFLSDPNEDSFREYRSAIMKLLREILESGYQHESYMGHDRNGIPRIRHVVRKINDKVDELYKEALISHYEPISMMALVAEITGLIVSLVA